MPEKRKRAPGGGRKPSPEPTRTHYISVRVTEAEKRRIMLAAKHNQNGQNSSEWLRNTLWNAAIDDERESYLRHLERCE